MLRKVQVSPPLFWYGSIKDCVILVSWRKLTRDDLITQRGQSFV